VKLIREEEVTHLVGGDLAQGKVGPEVRLDDEQIARVCINCPLVLPKFLRCKRKASPALWMVSVVKTGRSAAVSLWGRWSPQSRGAGHRCLEEQRRPIRRVRLRLRGMVSKRRFSASAGWAVQYSFEWSGLLVAVAHRGSMYLLDLDGDDATGGRNDVIALGMLLPDVGRWVRWMRTGVSAAGPDRSSQDMQK